jgi:hypothetical protein
MNNKAYISGDQPKEEGMFGTWERWAMQNLKGK